MATALDGGRRRFHVDANHRSGGPQGHVREWMNESALEGEWPAGCGKDLAGKCRHRILRQRCCVCYCLRVGDRVVAEPSRGVRSPLL